MIYYHYLKETKENGLTTILGAIVNVIIDLVLIKYIGLYAAALSTIIANIVICVIRYIRLKPEVHFKMNKMFLNKYKSIIIVNPELKYIGDIKEKILNIIGEFYVDSFEDMGNKKLVYEIQKIKIGHYIKTEFYAKDYKITNGIVKICAVKKSPKLDKR